MLMLSIFRLSSNFAKIIGRQPQNLQPLLKKSRKIAQYFQVQIPKQATQDQISKLYLSHLASNKFHLNSNLTIAQSKKFLQAQRQLKIIQYTKQLIAKNYKTMTPQAQNVINNFFDYASYVYFNVVLASKLNRQVSQYDKQLRNCIVGVNSFFMLMSSDRRRYKNFLKCFSLINIGRSNSHITSDSLMPNYRLCIDSLMSIPVKSYTHRQIFQIFKTFAKTNINHLYYQRATQANRYFWQGMKNYVWFSNPKQRKIILLTINSLNFYTEEILDKVEKLFFNNLLKNDMWKSQAQYNMVISVDELIVFLNTLIKFGRVNSKSYKGQYEKAITKLVEMLGDMDRALFSSTLDLFYMAGLWIPAYWNAFAKFIQNDQNNETQIYKLFTLKKLFTLYQNQIPQQIITLLSPTLQKKLQNFSGQKIINDYQQKQVNQKNLSCQIQMTNALRILNTGSIITQTFVQMFIVDIIIDGMVIVEINGNTHYLNNLDTMNKHYNLKTLFRTKLLEKLGYHVIDIDLSQFSEGSFDVIKMVHSEVLKFKKNKQIKQKQRAIQIQQINDLPI